MTDSSEYALDKLSVAVHALAVGPGDVRRRLHTAFMALFPVMVNDFPSHLQPDWEWIMKQLTRYDPVLWHDGKVLMGSVGNTLHHIRNSTGPKIAGRIVKLRDDLQSYLRVEQ